VALIKPQFEAGKDDVGKGGVVRDARVHRRVLEETVALAHELGLSVAGLIPSPLLGPAGNVEFLIHLRRAYNELVAPVVFIVEALHAARSVR
jgi:23S rRNA (cytidine1920-2'-O)/16S rRNA (cytidine1409-2'-O)-methyltransferase